MAKAKKKILNLLVILMIFVILLFIFLSLKFFNFKNYIFGDKEDNNSSFSAYGEIGSSGEIYEEIRHDDNFSNEPIVVGDLDYVSENDAYENLGTDKAAPSGNKNNFIVYNSQGNIVAWFEDSGDVYLMGSCFFSNNCDAPEDSFVIVNSRGDTVSYVDGNGNLCISEGECLDSYKNCNPDENALIIQNLEGENVSYLEESGSLCLIGKLYVEVMF